MSPVPLAIVTGLIGIDTLLIMKENTQLFDYNTTKARLKLSEYGRNVQNMVDYVMQLPTKEERNLYAQAVIDLMGQLNPHLRDVSDFTHKLWDHLFIISDFELDADSPYPKPSPETLQRKPEMLAYPSNHIQFRHYGKTIEFMIEKAKAIEEPERKSLFVQQLANFMKMAYITWNKDSVTDEIIKHDLHVLSNGELEVDESVNLSRVDPRSHRGNLRDKGGRQTSDKPGRQTGDKQQRQNGGRKRHSQNGKRY